MSDRQEILPPGYAEHEPWSGPGHSRRRRSRAGRRHPILLILLIVLVLLVTVAVAGFFWAEGRMNPGGHRGPDVSVQIPAGSSTSKIGSILGHAGVIHDSFLFPLYVKINGGGALLPGAYTLPKNSSYHAVISALTAGPKVIAHRLVIPEGYTIRQIANALAALPDLHLSAQRFLTAATSGEVRSPYEPRGVNNLEGLLFPATYEVRQGQTEVYVLEHMVGAFDDQASSLGLTAAAARLHETPYQVATVASIVEREAKLRTDRGPVASVIYNRLTAGMSLGADSTQAYYLRLTNPGVVPTASQYDQPSPYNSRLNKGLPPTPIGNAGMASLQAAASPPSTSYLYFVEVKPNGQLGFASTSAGFSQLQAQCRAANLC